MGLIADLIQFVRGEDGDAQIAEARGDLGGEDVVTAQHYQPTGFDGHPVRGDYLVLSPGPEKGTFVAVGYLDPKNAGTTRPGEVCLYLRDEDGDVQGELYLASEEPDWKAAAGAPLARSDRSDDLFAEVLAAFDEGIKNAVESTPGDGGLAAFTAAKAYLQTILGEKSTASDKGWVT